MDNKKVRFVVGTFMVSLPDFDSGIIVTAAILSLFREQVSLWPFVVGEVSVILADLDIVILLLRGHKIAFDHRLLFHKPILVIPIWALIAIVSPLYATIVAGCGMAHTIDDSIGNSQEWGTQLLWPVSKKTFVFFTRRDGLWKFVRSYEPDQYEKQTHEHALEEYYLRFGPKTSFTIFWTAVAVVVGIGSLLRMLS